MKLLFVHQNFPGQFKALAPAFAAMSDVSVAALSMQQGQQFPGIQAFTHVPTQGTTPNISPLMADAEAKMIRAASAVKTAQEMRAQGFMPDVIVAHPGWGESLFLGEVWPAARQLHFLEFFYHSRGVDTDFDPEFAHLDFDNQLRVASKQPSPLWALHQMDWGLSPTQWQKETYPRWEWDRVSVVHDGVDTRTIAPRAGLSITLQGAEQEAGAVLKSGDPIVTFVNRNLEPYRGYHIFMRALPEILAQHPTAQIMIVGGEGVSYGAAPPKGGVSWKQRFYDEVSDRIDKRRVHFLGNIPYPSFIGLLQMSAVHVYLTYPFVLSWSLLEAMACECLIIGSRTAPVMEVIEDGQNGVLVDFFDPAALSAAVLDGLRRPEAYRGMRTAARRTIVDKYDLSTVCLPAQVKLVRSVYEKARRH
jgi:glycosyltransferase involved in cell wall biosynthesis